MQIALHDRNSLDLIDWPESPEGRYARAFLEPMLKKGVKSFIRNVETELLILRAGELVFPVTMNSTEYGNSYVCSPYTHYVTYGREELRNLKNPPLEFALSLLLHGIGFFMKAASINRTVIVNNWMLSTNLYPPLTREQIEEICIFLKKRFPSHSISFRSLHDFGEKSPRSAFEGMSGCWVPSRQVYFFDPSRAENFESKELKKDFQLYESRSSGLSGPETIRPDEYGRIVELYNALYLDKYSKLNPQFTEEFVALAIEKKILEVKVFRDEKGGIEAVIGFFVRNGYMTTPLLGYDTSRPLKDGLYRLLTAQLTIEARERRLLLHRSSGAASFKRARGALPRIEWLFVLVDHLPWYRRAVWKSLSFIVGGVGVRLLEKYEL